MPTPTSGLSSTSMHVERYNYAAQLGDDLPELMADLERMLVSGHYILTEEVLAFERAFGDYLEVAHVRGGAQRHGCPDLGPARPRRRTGR